MKTQTKAKAPKTQFVPITTDIQLTNNAVEKAYTLMVEKAINVIGN